MFTILFPPILLPEIKTTTTVALFVALEGIQQCHWLLSSVVCFTGLNCVSNSNNFEGTRACVKLYRTYGAPDSEKKRFGALNQDLFCSCAKPPPSLFSSDDAELEITLPFLIGPDGTSTVLKGGTLAPILLSKCQSVLNLETPIFLLEKTPKQYSKGINGMSYCYWP